MRYARFWWVGCLALAALTLLAPSAPTTDPWGWIVWGREAIHLQLSTVVPGAPSWKPLPVLFTAPLALTGSIAPSLWLLVARAGALAGLLVAARMAARLAGPWAAALTVIGLVLSAGWVRAFAHGYTEPMAIGLLALAVEQQLEGHWRRAITLSALVALARPEGLALVGVYGVLAWRRGAVGLPFVAGAMASVVALWVIPDWVGSGQFMHASRVAAVVVPTGPAAQRAALTDGAQILLWPLALAGVAGVALAWQRREPAILWLAGIAAGWSALLVGLIALGYPPEARFFALPAGLWCIVGAVGLTWIARAPQSSRWRLATALALGLLLVPFAAARGHHSTDEAIDAVDRAQLEAQLRTVLRDAGGDRDRPVLPRGLGWMKGEVAWQLNLPLRDVHQAHTSDQSYVKGLTDPDTEPLPTFPANRTIRVHAPPAGELLLEPFGNSRIELAHRSRERLEPLARAGRWQALLLEQL
jgi:hypothetical protein